MKSLIYILSSVLVISCSSTEKSITIDRDKFYKIKTIQKVNAGYVITMRRKDTSYRVFSCTDPERNSKEKCKEIKIGKKYKLTLIPLRKKARITGSLKTDPTTYISNYSVNEGTLSYIEFEDDIETYLTKDLNGICYIKQLKNKIP